MGATAASVDSESLGFSRRGIRVSTSPSHKTSNQYNTRPVPDDGVGRRHLI
jgi:hypothetical protein